LEMEQRHFCQASLEYVFRLQEVHERKKFEFVETVRFYFKIDIMLSHINLKKIVLIIYKESCFVCLKQLLGFMYGWLTFYHQGYEVAKEFRPYMTDLQVRLQKVRVRFNQAKRVNRFNVLTFFRSFFGILDPRKLQHNTGRGRIFDAQDAGGA
jgi:hypothetical protein